MSQFDSNTLEHLKKLCRIDSDEEESLDILHSLQGILNYMEELKELNVEGVEPCNYVLRSMLKNLMRDDVVEDVLSRETFLANAPESVGGMIRTPPVLKDL